MELVTPSAFRRADALPGGRRMRRLRLDGAAARPPARSEAAHSRPSRCGASASSTSLRCRRSRIHPSPLNYRLRSRLHRDGDAVGFYAMRSNRVVPLARECEVVGIETARQRTRAGRRDLGDRPRALDGRARAHAHRRRATPTASTPAPSSRSTATCSARCCASSPRTPRAPSTASTPSISTPASASSRCRWPSCSIASR